MNTHLFFCAVLLTTWQTTCGEENSLALASKWRTMWPLSLLFRQSSLDQQPRELRTEFITYQRNDGVNLTGYLAVPMGMKPGSAPGILIAHDWDGRDEFENGKAVTLAKLGYVALAMDVYGKTGSNAQENSALMAPFQQNRSHLLETLRVNHQQLLNVAEVDAEKIGAIGFCFGGSAVLEMARDGWPLRGVVSFHGGLKPFGGEQPQPPPVIKAKTLVCTGHADPLIPPQDVTDFKAEMENRIADWQMHVFGNNTVHGFTRPSNTSSERNAYHPDADHRSWQLTKLLFEEAFQ